MADTQSYKITSAKDPFDGTTQVLVEGSYGDLDAKFVQVGGDPVELSEEQVGRLKDRFNVRKASDDAEVSSGESKSNASSSPVGEGGAVSVERSGSGDTGSDAGGASATPGARAR